MTRPLSDQMADLSDRAKSAQESTAAAAKEEKDKLNARLDQIRVDASARADQQKKDVAQSKENVAAKWSQLQDQVRSNVDGIQADFDARKAERDASRAAKKADNAEENAAYAIAFAYDAIDYAETAAIDAIIARDNAAAASS